MTDNQTLVTLVSVIAEVPSLVRAPQVDTHLAGIGMLVAQPHDAGWRFDLRIRLAADERALAPLLAWAADAMPTAGQVIAWQLAECVVSPLLAAAETADPVLAEAFLGRLAPLVACKSEDIAVPHGGAGAPPLGVDLASSGIPGAALTPAEVGEARRRGRLAEIRSMLEIQAIAVLDRWADERGEDGKDLRTGLGQWLDERRARATRS